MPASVKGCEYLTNYGGDTVGNFATQKSWQEAPTYTKYDMTKNEFEQWLEENQHIFDAFCVEALKVKNIGFKHYSARTIIKFLRHHTNLREASGGFKINNDAVPHMARLFGEKYPNFHDLFEYRKAPHG